MIAEGLSACPTANGDCRRCVRRNRINPLAVVKPAIELGIDAQPATRPTVDK